MDKLNLNDMNYQIEILQRALSDDGYGSQQESWLPYKTVWAEVTRTDRFSEVIANEGLRSQQMLKFKIYFDDTISFEMRIRHQNRIYYIVNLLELGYRDGLEIVGRMVE